MGKKIYFSKEIIDKIINYYCNDKKSCKKIGNIYDVSEWTILRLLKKHSIQTNNKSRYKKYSVNENFLNNINKINSFFIGLMASDGCIKNDRVFSISQSGDNGLDLIKQINNWLQYNGIIYHRTTTHKIAHSTTITSKKLVNKLNEHNVTLKKSFTYKYNNIALFKEFLQGYIEGDGSVGIYKTNTTTYFCISFFGNEYFKNSIVDLLPIKPLINVVNDDFYEIKFSGKNAIKFCDWLWENPVYPQSLKYEKFLNYKKNYLKNTRFFIYENLNKKIIGLLNNEYAPKDIANKLNINKKTVYNLKYNLKNGRNTY